MAEAISVARPYAVAVFDQASNLGDFKGWSDTLQTMAECVNHPEIGALIVNPRVDRSQLEGLMLAVCGEKTSTFERNFVKFLVENHRLILLPEIAAIFELMRAEAEQSVDVEITSAFDLDEAQKQKITVAMNKRMGRDVRLSCKTNSDLLGGIIIRSGDKVIDGSARTNLSELAHALA